MAAGDDRRRSTDYSIRWLWVCAGFVKHMDWR